jgi:ABC-type transport system involved in cytochrome bd biosynthesis fused ATPase/permease subunit
VATARALLSSARLIILDEPTAGLDAHSADGLMRGLDESTRGRGLLVITHRLSSLEWFDEIMVISSGRVIECGAPSDLAKGDTWFRRALGLQNRLLDPGEQ